VGGPASEQRLLPQLQKCWGETLRLLQGEEDER